MTYRIWLQNMDGDEITILARLRKAKAAEIRKRLDHQRLTGILSDFFVLDESLSINDLAGSAIKEFIHQKKQP